MTRMFYLFDVSDYLSLLSIIYTEYMIFLEKQIILHTVFTKLK